MLGFTTLGESVLGEEIQRLWFLSQGKITSKIASPLAANANLKGDSKAAFTLAAIPTILANVQAVGKFLFAVKMPARITGTVPLTAGPLGSSGSSFGLLPLMLSGNANVGSVIAISLRVASRGIAGMTSSTLVAAQSAMTSAPLGALVARGNESIKSAARLAGLVPLYLMGAAGRVNAKQSTFGAVAILARAKIATWTRTELTGNAAMQAATRAAIMAQDGALTCIAWLKANPIAALSTRSNMISALFMHARAIIAATLPDQLHGTVPLLAESHTRAKAAGHLTGIVSILTAVGATIKTRSGINFLTPLATATALLTVKAKALATGTVQLYSRSLTTVAPRRIAFGGTTALAIKIVMRNAARGALTGKTALIGFSRAVINGKSPILVAAALAGKVVLAIKEQVQPTPKVALYFVSKIATAGRMTMAARAALAARNLVNAKAKAQMTARLTFAALSKLAVAVGYNQLTNGGFIFTAPLKTAAAVKNHSRAALTGAAAMTAKAGTAIGTRLATPQMILRLAARAAIIAGVRQPHNLWLYARSIVTSTLSMGRKALTVAMEVVPGIASGNITGTSGGQDVTGSPSDDNAVTGSGSNPVNITGGNQSQDINGSA